jgi:hypothetical protein
MNKPTTAVDALKILEDLPPSEREKLADILQREIDDRRKAELEAMLSKLDSQ